MNEWAILYLDSLRIVQVGTRDEINTLISDARQAMQPFTVLRYRERCGRKCWAVQETCYLDY